MRYSPLVSIIVPNYNHAPYLEERIESILNQSYRNFELILLDDCSTDYSRDIIERYRDNEYVSHIIYNEHNTHNTFIQWEKGIKLSKGEYIWIAESDDVASPQLLETLMVELLYATRAVVAFCHSQMIDSNSQPIPLTWHPKGSSGRTNIYEGKWFLRNRMLIKNYIYNASMAVFKKSAFQSIPDNYQHYRYCGDWLFWCHVCQQGQVIEVAQQLNFYRQHQNKVTTKSQLDGNKWRDAAGILQELSDLLTLSPLQRHCLKGRWTKRFIKENGTEFSNIKNEYPNIYDGNKVDIFLYEIGKIFGFLKQ